MKKSRVHIFVLLTMFGCIITDIEVFDDFKLFDNLVNVTQVTNSDPNDDGAITPGETTEPILEVSLPDSCTQSIIMQHRICLAEPTGNGTAIVIDEDMNLMCAWWRAIADCTNGKYVTSEFECAAGNNEYCNITSLAGKPVVRCGWKVMQIQILNPKDHNIWREWGLEDIGDAIPVNMFDMGDPDAFESP